LPTVCGELSLAVFPVNRPKAANSFRNGKRNVCRKGLRHPNSFFDRSRRNQQQNAHKRKTLRISPILRA